jgi:hypothetical protein
VNAVLRPGCLASVKSEYVSVFEATRWVVAAQFTGGLAAPTVRQVSAEYALTIDVNTRAVASAGAFAALRSASRRELPVVRRRD